MFGLIRVVRHYIFKTSALDLSLFDYAIANTLEGTLLYQHFYWDQSFLALHFSPILFLIVPFYLIYNDPITLILLQVVCVGLSAVPFYYIAQWKLGDAKIALLLAVSYLLYRKLSTAVMYDFHMETMEPLFIFSAFYFLVRKKYPFYFLFFALALCVKEDVSLYMVPFGIFVFWILKEKKIGAATIAISILWFVVAKNLMTSDWLSNTKDVFYFSSSGIYGGYGNSFSAMVTAFLTQPGKVFAEVFNPLSAKTFFNMLGCLLFIPLASPSAFFPTLLPFFANFVSGSSLQKGLGLYYSSPILPFLFIALVYGLANLRRRYFADNRKALFILCCSILIINLANSSLWQLLRPSRIAVTGHHVRGHEIIKTIPPESSVSAQAVLLPHIERRKEIFVFPEKALEADFVFLDAKSNQWSPSHHDYQNSLDQLKTGKQHELLIDEDGFLFFRKKL